VCSNSLYFKKYEKVTAQPPRGESAVFFWGANTATTRFALVNQGNYQVVPLEGPDYMENLRWQKEQ